MTYTIQKTAAGYCVSVGGNHYMAPLAAITTTAGDPNLAVAPCFQASTMSPTPSPMMSPTPSPTAGGTTILPVVDPTIQTTAATTITSSPIAFAAGNPECFLRGPNESSMSKESRT